MLIIAFFVKNINGSLQTSEGRPGADLAGQTKISDLHQICAVAQQILRLHITMEVTCKEMMMMTMMKLLSTTDPSCACMRGPEAPGR